MKFMRVDYARTRPRRAKLAARKAWQETLARNIAKIDARWNADPITMQDVDGWESAKNAYALYI